MHHCKKSIMLLSSMIMAKSGFAYDTVRSRPADFPSKKSISKTIVISKSGVYDFKNVLHEWKGKGTCNQKENQPYILRIAASNVTVKNFAYINAPDGIHIGTSSNGQGHSDGKVISNIVLDNVTGWACEDALTTQYGVQDLTIKNSKFHANPNSSYRDKSLQLNFGNQIHIENSSFFDSVTCVNLRGGIKARILNNYFENCSTSVRASTIEGYKGKMKKNPIEIDAEANFVQGSGGFFDRPEFIRADGNVSGRSFRDDVRGADRVKNEKGATVRIQD